MNESSSFTQTDLIPFKARLGELREIVAADKLSGSHPIAMTNFLERKLAACGKYKVSGSRPLNWLLVDLTCPFYLEDTVLGELAQSLSVLSVELVPIHQKLVALRRQLVALAAKPKPSKTDLKPLQEELRKIDALVAFPSLPLCSRRMLNLSPHVCS